MTIGQRLAKTARKALEDLAVREFGREKILESCRVAAAQGYMTCEIRPSIPIDVSTTDHAKTLLAELRKEWLQCAWIPYAVPGQPAYKILELRWDTQRPAS